MPTTYSLVTKGFYSDPIGLFSDAAMAQRVATHVEGHVSILPLDPWADQLREGQLPFEVTFGHDGSMASCLPTTPAITDPDDPIDPTCLLALLRGDAGWTQLVPYTDGGGYTCVWATSPDEAIRRAQERYQAFQASRGDAGTL